MQKSQPLRSEFAEPTLPESSAPVATMSSAMPMSAVTANVAVAGAVIADYELLRMIGEGGYGQVWICKNAVGNYRAAKFIYRTNFTEEGPYLREFRGVSEFMQLKHPLLLQLFHIGPNVPRDHFYYIMELGDDETCGQPIAPEKYRARTLASDLKRRKRLPAGECVEMGRSIAQGLAFLHSRSLIHRDIKPSNIIYVDGQAKLADVGLVANPETTDLSLVGTRGYMDPNSPSTLTSDIYALGKVLYVALTGLSTGQFPELPADDSFAGKRAAIADLMRIVTKACADNVAERYPSIAEMVADLERSKLE